MSLSFLSSVSHPEVQYTNQLLSKGIQTQNGNCQMKEQHLEADRDQDPTLSIVCVDSFIQDLSEVNRVESNKRRALCNSSTGVVETQPDSAITAIRDSTGEPLQIAEGSDVAKDRSSKTEKGNKNNKDSHAHDAKQKKKCMKRSSSLVNLNPQKSAKLSVSHNYTGICCCKACGKTFHYMYTLRAHAQSHTMDKIHICGICGKKLESTKSLVLHLQNHTKRNKCGTCGKQFSNNSRLKRHRIFHRPKGLHVISST